MQAALRRRRDNRQPADSGEYQPVPIRYIPIKPAQRPSYPPATVGPAKRPTHRFLRSASLLFVPLLQAGFAVAGVVAVVRSDVALPDWLMFSLWLALPALVTAMTCLLLAPLVALHRDKWRECTMLFVGNGTGLWGLIVPVIALYSTLRHGWGLEVLYALLASVMAGCFLFAAALPGLFVLGLCKGPIERIARHRRRRTAANYYLTRGWRAP